MDTVLKVADDTSTILLLSNSIVCVYIVFLFKKEKSHNKPTVVIACLLSLFSFLFLLL